MGEERVFCSSDNVPRRWRQRRQRDAIRNKTRRAENGRAERPSTKQDLFSFSQNATLPCYPNLQFSPLYSNGANIPGRARKNTRSRFSPQPLLARLFSLSTMSSLLLSSPVASFSTHSIVITSARDHPLRLSPLSIVSQNGITLYCQRQHAKSTQNL